tara:strand:- start:310 stop:957 length:648 start_codon:yes stop_codon:yes gene_type:complete
MRKLVLIMAVVLAGCGDPAAPGADPGSAAEEAAATDYEQFWTTTQRAARHTCPSNRCGVVGQLMFRESAHVYERHDGWARISEPYAASCTNGRSDYVDSGDARCVLDNGIVDGRFTEWVQLSALSGTRPADPAEIATADERLVAQSDDFTEHRAAFVLAAGTLIREGRCTAADFEEQGGWVKSSNHRDQLVYFTYCGRMTVANRIYLDARTGRIF